MQYSKIALAVMLTAAATAVSATDTSRSTAALTPASCSKMPTAANAPLR